MFTCCVLCYSQKWGVAQERFSEIGLQEDEDRKQLPSSGSETTVDRVFCQGTGNQVGDPVALVQERREWRMDRVWRKGQTESISVKQEIPL